MIDILVILALSALAGTSLFSMLKPKKNKHACGGCTSDCKSCSKSDTFVTPKPDTKHISLKSLTLIK